MTKLEREEVDTILERSFITYKTSPVFKYPDVANNLSTIHYKPNMSFL